MVAKVGAEFVRGMIEASRPKASYDGGFGPWDSILDEILKSIEGIDEFTILEKEAHVFIASNGSTYIKFDASPLFSTGRPMKISSRANRDRGAYKMWSVAPDAGGYVSDQFRSKLAYAEMDSILNACPASTAISRGVSL